MSEKPEKPRLKYIKWFVPNACLLEEDFSAAEVGELFLAVMKYARDGTETEVSPAIKYPYKQQKMAVDLAWADYRKQCETNAANRRGKGKSGKKSKSGADEAGEDAPPKPPAPKSIKPTKTEIKNGAESLKDERDFYFEPYQVDEAYSRLSEGNFLIAGKPIRSRADWMECLSWT